MNSNLAVPESNAHERVVMAWTVIVHRLSAHLDGNKHIYSATIAVVSPVYRGVAAGPVQNWK